MDRDNDNICNRAAVATPTPPTHTHYSSRSSNGLMQRQPTHLSSVIVKEISTLHKPFLQEQREHITRACWHVYRPSVIGASTAKMVARMELATHLTALAHAAIEEGVLCHHAHISTAEAQLCDECV